MAKAAEVAIEQMEERTEDLAPPKPNRRKLVIIAIASAALLASAGGTAWHFLHGNADDSDEDIAPVAGSKTGGKTASKAAEKGKAARENVNKDKKPSVYLPLETFTVNLQTEASDRYLQTTIVFEVTDDKTTEAIKAQMPAIRSKLLLLLSAKSPTELGSPKGKENLAEEIMAEARKQISVKGPDQALLQVHFNSFVIQ